MKLIIFLCLIVSCHQIQTMQLSDYDGLIEEISINEEKHLIDDEFTKIFANPTIGSIYGTIDKLPSHQIEKMKKSEQNRPFFMALAGMNRYILDHIFDDYVFEGNKEVKRKFYNRPYGRAMLALVHAIETVEQNPEGFLSLDNCFGISPALRELYIRLNSYTKRMIIHGNYGRNGQAPELSLCDEQLIRREMSREISSSIRHWLVRCQTPYNDRLKSALTDGITCAYRGAGYCGLARGYNLFSFSDTLTQNIISRMPTAIHSGYTSIPSDVLAIAPPVVDMVATINRIFYAKEELIVDLSSYLMFFAGAFIASCSCLITGFHPAPLTSNSLDIVAHECIGGTLGGIYGVASSLCKDMTKYPTIRSIQEIKDEAFRCPFSERIGDIL